MLTNILIMICRILSLKGFDGVLIGRDLSDILKEGHVYSVTNIMDVIILKDLGEHAHPDWDLSKKGKYDAKGTISQYVMSPCVYLTKEERKAELENNPEFDKEGFKTDPLPNWDNS